MPPKFTFYEVVDVVSGRQVVAPVVGHRGAVLGMAQCDDGRWVYAIHLLESGEGWDMEESELVSTGIFMTREDFYEGDSISVEVDTDSGEGWLKR